MNVPRTAGTSTTPGPQSVLLVHAFSRRNAGDGLLVDLSLERLERAGVGPQDVWVAALDAASFADLPHVLQVPSEPWGRVTGRAVRAAGHLAQTTLTAATGYRIASGELAHIARSATGIVAVGGGYLRAGNLVEAGGALLNHVPQLTLAARAPVPSVYLPQSIGPLPGRVGRLVARLLRQVDRVYARDETTLDELGRPDNVSRMPDLAVLKLAEQLTPTTQPRAGDVTILIPRDLGSEEYDAAFERLAGLVPEVRWGVQAAGVGRKNDADHIRRVGGDAVAPVRQLLEDSTGGVVVSVRLHGALQSLLAGYPAIHLSYQRKGWGAYRDLGLEQYVHDARTFDPALVAAQVEELRADPDVFFKRLHEAAPHLQAMSTELDRQLHTTLNRN